MLVGGERNLLTPREATARTRPVARLTPAQQALAVQYRPMAHKYKAEQWGPFCRVIGWDEAGTFTDLFLTEAAERFDPNYRTPDGKTVEFSTFLYNHLWLRFQRLYGDRKLNASRLNVIPESSLPAMDDTGETALAFASSPADTLADDRDDRRDLRDRTDRLLAVLPPRERFVIEARNGMLDGTVWTMQAIAEAMQVSRARVGQIEEKALHRLRTHPLTMVPAGIPL